MVANDAETSPEASSHERPAYLDPGLPAPARAADLVRRLSVEEKISQMLATAPAVERLSIPAYDWWNECLHGVGHAGTATVFPQAIGLAATWDVDLMSRVATAISDEARAKHHEFARRGLRTRYKGLTFWSPNVNIFRDPRWGRGQETYGEDPYLTARLGVAFVRGLQGNDPHYLKLVATPKHFAAHSGPEGERHHFDAQVGPQDLWATYLPAFEACLQEGGAVSVMGAYSRLNGEPCCASKTLLGEILRGRWGFQGYVVSDCGAIRDIHTGHGTAATAEEAAALALRAGCDLNCGETYRALGGALARGLISEEEIDRSLRRLFEARMHLGMFDPPDLVPYAQIPYSVNDCPAHRELARQAARQSIVLLRNEGGLLPLRSDLGSVAVIGPNAGVAEALLGNYKGTPSHVVTPLDGIRACVSPRTSVRYAVGCELVERSPAALGEAVRVARLADVAILVLGLDQRLEGEEGQRDGVRPGSCSQGDRLELGLPAAQEELLQAVLGTGTPVVLVLVNGGAVGSSAAMDHVPAIVEAWYPGEEGGAAIGEVLFGEHNPGGRLPVTVYRSLDQLPPFTDYGMAGRTYRYFQGQPLFPFGHGLSYTRFGYRNLAVSSPTFQAPGEVTVSAEVENTGERAGDEVVQLYLRHVGGGADLPLRELQGFRRIHLAPGERRRVAFTLSGRQLTVVDADGRRVLLPGEVEIAVGGSQAGALRGRVRVVGDS